MAKKDCIREMFYVKGLSVSEIARETGHDRKTVRQYVNREDWNLLERQEEMTVSKLDPYKPVIDGWLEDDRKAGKKQRHTARRIFQMVHYIDWHSGRGLYMVGITPECWSASSGISGRHETELVVDIPRNPQLPATLQATIQPRA